MLTDSHAHLLDPSFETDLEEVIERAKSSNIEYINNCVDSSDGNEVEEGIVLSKKYENIFLSVGLHPFDAEKWNNSMEKILIDFPSDKLIAIGEIGIDPTYNVPVEIQKNVFRQQIKIAMDRKLPIVIHCRHSFNEIYQILIEEKFDQPGVLHTFSGTWNDAEKFLKLGFYISFSGVLTYSKKAKDVALKTPFDRILLETDSPYLAPLPYRGKRNEPSFIISVFEELSRIKNCPLEETEERVSKNFISLFLRGMDRKWN